eukprot:1142065-Pelagomonas_calceolata.AAC.1
MGVGVFEIAEMDTFENEQMGMGLFEMAEMDTFENEQMGVGLFKMEETNVLENVFTCSQDGPSGSSSCGVLLAYLHTLRVVQASALHAQHINAALELLMLFCWCMSMHSG